MLSSALGASPLVVALLMNSQMSPTVSRDSSNHLILEADCSELSSIDSALIAWKNAWGETPGLPTDVLPGAQHSCTEDIDPITPSEIARLEGTTTRHSGPNCWNTSLYASRIAKYRRATSAKEMTFWMGSPLCRPVGDDEPALPGDIIAIRFDSGAGPGEMHSFIYLTDRFSFSKAGFATQFDYELLPAEEVFTTFALGPGVAEPRCRRVSGTPLGCQVWANYFRCITYQNYIDGVRFADKSDFLDYDRRLTDVERELSDIVIGKEWSNSELGVFNAKIDALEKEAQEHLRPLSPADSDPQKAAAVLWRSALARIESYREQLELLSSDDD